MIENEGRRIEKIEGGFFILNGKKWREQQTAESRRAYMRDYMQKQEEADELQRQIEYRMIRENLRQAELRRIALELKRNQAATVIQSKFRGARGQGTILVINTPIENSPFCAFILKRLLIFCNFISELLLIAS